MKKFLSKLFSILMILTMCFAGTGCLEIFGVGDGLDFFNDLWEKFQNGDISEEEYYEQLANSQSTPLYGTKVLYRPDHYDFNEGSGGTEEEENDYYGKYAWSILSRLYLIYGVSDINNIDIVDYDLFNDFDPNNLPYLYDSIRYQVDKQAVVSKAIKFENDSWVDDNLDNNYVMLSADFNNAWTWSFDSDLDGDLSVGLKATGNYIKPNDADILESFIYNSQIQSYYDPYFYNNIDPNDYQKVQEYLAGDGVLGGHYSDVSNNYLSVYLGTSSAMETETENYSDFVKALEYVIYSYSLDLTPGEVVVDIGKNGDKYYQVSVIETVNGLQQQLTVDQALSQIKEKFDRLGSYVGIAERNKIKIQNWILDNVIGQNAMANDDVTVYSGATQITYNETTFVATSVAEANSILKSLGASVTLPENSINTTFKSEEVGRDYANTVEKIIDGVCSDVTIGSNEDEDVNVDERFLASEIIEYYGNAFAPGGDEDPFPYFEDFESGKGSRAIRPLEYQSAVIMFKEEVNVQSLVVAFQYDADLDGYQTATGEVFDGSRYLTIEVGLNYFNHATGQKTVVQTKTVNVPDGKLSDIMGDDDLDEASKKAGIDFAQSVDFGLEDPILGDRNKDLICGPFNVDIGNGILKTDVGRNDYRGNPFVSQDPITIVGTTAVKDYYEIIEPTEEQIAQGETYLTGQLNAERFKGSDGCDYLEVTYRVIKKVGDTTTNYRFYTGITVSTE